MKTYSKYALTVLLIGFILMLSACGGKKVKVPGGAEQYKGQYYETVIAELTEAGFTDVQSEIVDDLTSSSNLKDGTVESVTINDNNSFEAESEFPADAVCVVVYHIIPKIKVPVSRNEIQDMSLEEIKKSFTDVGFTDITISTVYDKDPDTMTSDHETEMKINGTAIDQKGGEVPFDSRIEIVCHYPYTKYNAKIKVSCLSNLLFDKYDVNFSIDDEKQGTITHGGEKEYELQLKEGDHTLLFSKKDDSQIKGEIKISVTSDLEAAYIISCHTDHIDVDEEFVDYQTELASDEVKIMCTELDYYFRNYKEVEAELKQAGFTNIVTEPLYDIVFGITDSESIDSLTINGKHDYKRGDIFKKDAAILIRYHMPEEDDPAKQEKEETESSKGTTDTESKKTAEPEKPFYSTNDLETAKKGNSGKFAYIRKAKEYDVYFLIDYDEGYVFNYTYRQGDQDGLAFTIDTGDLNEGLHITHHSDDGLDDFSYVLKFHERNNPTIMVLYDRELEAEYMATSIDEAIKIRDSLEFYID